MAAVAVPQSASGQDAGRTSIVKYMLASVKIIIILFLVSTYNLPSI